MHRLALALALASLIAACGPDEPARPGSRDGGPAGGDAAVAAGDDATASDAAAGDDAAVSGLGDDAGPDVAPTFGPIFREVFAPNGCTERACHGPHVDLQLLVEEDAYRALIDVPGGCPNMVRVRPGSPDDSYLWRKIAPGRGVCGVPMPPDGRVLSAADLERVRAWIAAGARR